MEKTKKYIIASIVAFLVLVLFNTNVFAYEQTYNAWRQDVNNDGRLDLVFRRYSTATNLQLKQYHDKKSYSYLSGFNYEYDGKTYITKWIYVDEPGIYKPLETEFSTVGYTFHIGRLNSYTEKPAGTVGLGAMAAGIATKNTSSNIKQFFDSLNSNFILSVDIDNSGVSGELYQYYGITSAINKVDFGTGLNMSTIVPKERMVYRYAIATYLGTNIYIEDRVIYNEQLKELREAMVANETTLENKFGNKNIVRISDIVISKAKYDIGGYEISETLGQFLSQYKKYGYNFAKDDNFWPDNILGKEGMAEQSIVNVFDNYIKLPESSQRKVIVRHINLGNRSSLSKEAFEASNRYCDDSTADDYDKECSPNIKVIKNDKSFSFKTASKKDGEYITKIEIGSSKELIVQEAYTTGDIEIYNSIEKSALKEKTCIGYNITTGSSFSIAISNMTNKINKGIYEIGTVAKLEGLPEESETECVVIDFYYTEKPEEIIVNHLYVDNNNIVISDNEVVISDNDYAYTGVGYTEKVSRVKTKYNSLGFGESKIYKTQAIYRIAKGQSLLVKTAYNLRSKDVSYVGFQLYGEVVKNEDILGTQVDVSHDWYDSSASWLGVVVPDGIKQVNFYYYEKAKEEASIPKISTGLLVHFMAGRDCFKNGRCRDDGTTAASTSGLNKDGTITSIPSGVKANVGITSIPKLMVSAINLETISPEFNTHEFDVVLDYKCGRDEAKMYITDVNYSFGYDRVKELVINKITKGTNYDASPKWPNTSGTRIFEWKDSKGNYTDKKEYKISVPLVLNLYGVDSEEPIENDPDIIDNYYNYVKISGSHDFVGGSTIQAFEGLYTDIMDPEYLIKYGVMNGLAFKGVYLTRAEFDAVDANDDGKIIGCNVSNTSYSVALAWKSDSCSVKKCDIHYAKKILNEKYEAWQAKEKEFDGIKKEYYEEKAKLDAIIEEYNKAKAAYEKAKEEADGLKADYNRISDDLTDKRAEADSYLDQLIEKGLPIPTDTDKDTIKNQHDTAETEKKKLEKANADLEAANKTLSENITAEETKKTNIDACTNSKNCNDAILKKMYEDLTKYGDVDGTKTALDKAKQTKADAHKKCNRVLGFLWWNHTDDCEKATDAVEKAQTAYDNAVAYKSAQESAIATKKEALKEQADSNIAAYEEQINANNAIIAANTTLIADYTTTIDNTTLQLNYLDALAGIPGIVDDLEEKSSEYTKASEELEKATAKLNELEFKKQLQEIHMKPIEIQYNLTQAIINEVKGKYYDYKDYCDILLACFANYKDRYEQFLELKKKMSEPNAAVEVANYLGIEIKFEIANMLVSVNLDGKDITLSDASKQKKQFEYELSNILNEPPAMQTDPTIYNSEIYKRVGGNYAFYQLYDIPYTRSNGVRTIAAEAKYVTEVLIGKDGISPKEVVDNVYYSENIDDAGKNGKIKNGVFKIDYDGHIAKSQKKVNIYTPIFVSATLESKGIIDQSTTAISQNDNVQTIQVSTPFTITLGNTKDTPDKAYGITDTSEFCKGYYIKFNYDIHKVKINGKVYNNGERVKAGTWIGLIEKNASGATTIEATPYTEVKDATINIAEEELSSYVVRAVAYNATTSMINQAQKYLNLLDLISSRNPLKPTVENICTNETTTGVNDVPSYFVERTYDVVVLNKLYDFRITDIKDVSWKKVFREPVNNKINAHTGTVYYTGSMKWQIDNNGNNSIVKRTASEIGTAPLRILPLGPYKNTDLTYIKAPKLGYTFSFDIKSTGEYYDKKGKIREEKKVSIGTKFYYISDDGKTFLEEGKGGIYLFYKNSSGQYVRIDDNGGGYNLTFTPNDGYRLLTTTETVTLSKAPLSLGNLRNITLDYKMATVSQTYSTDISANNGLVITYYGEYKLPNSTIAVKVDSSGNYDINKPLKNGYIGVIFDIAAVAGNDHNGNPISLKYSKNTNGVNTSQWDYEGYLGMPKNKVGKSYSTTLKLEGGNWTITNSIYNRIKGTVILYDVDEKAANDYE